MVLSCRKKKGQTRLFGPDLPKRKEVEQQLQKLLLSNRPRKPELM